MRNTNEHEQLSKIFDETQRLKAVEDTVRINIALMLDPNVFVTEAAQLNNALNALDDAERTIKNSTSILDKQTAPYSLAQVDCMRGKYVAGRNAFFDDFYKFKLPLIENVLDNYTLAHTVSENDIAGLMAMLEKDKHQLENPSDDYKAFYHKFDLGRLGLGGVDYEELAKRITDVQKPVASYYQYVDENGNILDPVLKEIVKKGDNDMLTHNDVIESFIYDAYCNIMDCITSRKMLNGMLDVFDAYYMEFDDAGMRTLYYRNPDRRKVVTCQVDQLKRLGRRVKSETRRAAKDEKRSYRYYGSYGRYMASLDKRGKVETSNGVLYGCIFRDYIRRREEAKNAAKLEYLIDSVKDRKAAEDSISDLVYDSSDFWQCMVLRVPPIEHFSKTVFLSKFEAEQMLRLASLSKDESIYNMVDSSIIMPEGKFDLHDVTSQEKK